VRHLPKDVNPKACLIGFLVVIGCTAVVHHANAYGPDSTRTARAALVSAAGVSAAGLVDHRADGDLGVQRNTQRHPVPDSAVLAQNGPPNYPGYPRQWGQGQQVPTQQAQPRQQSAQGAQAEQAFRNALVMKGISGGFGGIFGPSLKKWVNTPSAPPQGGEKCRDYSEFAAKQACSAGDGWAADRLQNNESDGAEKDWYNR
jgi:hypothetical protein